MTPLQFRHLTEELVEENPLAVRAVLKLCEVRFTDKVSTLAVTCEEKPVLLVNLDFVKLHCRSDTEVKAVICHEFLHVLLRHTEHIDLITPARHLAFDAVINAIIHRSFGPKWSSLMSRYYSDVRDLRKLLRPMNKKELAALASQSLQGGENAVPGWVRAWASLYEGCLVADDIAELAESLANTVSRRKPNAGAAPFSLDEVLRSEIIPDLFGNHDGLAGPLPDALARVLDQALRQMNGGGIWRAPSSRRVGTNPYEALFVARNEPTARWRRKTLAVLKRHLTPDHRSRAHSPHLDEARLPILSPTDRRAFLRCRWSRFLPDVTWSMERLRPDGSAQIYLDVSGSMYAEMPEIIALLQCLSRYIRRPLWAFSDVVAPARIESGQLKTETTGGTSMTCVLAHVLKTRPSAAIVVTDGYIERLDRAIVGKLAGTRLHVLLTRDGNGAELERAGLPYTQLDRLPA
ncbi:hypothetical protein AzCIB_1350 [Azoarcus sp. CIB]|uniref:hypothetical protein n=1 Tax=Aromatoleum sp. (strain CIB) TaxID=198107 RepID=UPI00067CAB81|nr:hypothetical protein [Azoarcus sp. CIB]AKU11255.1 hypothetical protein AzCIB_1350 [Azoarcus sp. CIB]